MNMPRLLSTNFTELGVLHPSKYTPTIELTSLGNVKMSLPMGQLTVGFRQWVKHVLPNGNLVIYRAGSAPLACGKEQQVSLSHGIVTLEDELTPADTTLTGTPRAILAALLGYQRTVRWQLGSAPDTGQYSLDVNKHNLLRAFWDAIELFTGYAPTYDFTTSPWTVRLTALSSTPACECRLSRNIASVSVNYDDAALCTRVCAPQLTDGQMIADTASTWGEVSRDLGVADDAPADEVTAYAQRYLAKHKNPAMYAEVDALEISKQTGEPLDAFSIGLMCRCALPDYGITVDAPIVSMRYDDLVQKPQSIRLSLGQKIKDAGMKIAKVESETAENTSGLRGAGAGLRATQTTLIEQGESLITLAAWGVTADGKLGEASIQIDGLNAAIVLKASQTEVDGLTTRVSAAEIDIDGANAAIALKASQTEMDAVSGRVTTAEAELVVQAGQISSKVSNGDIASTINQTPQSVTIKASKINLEGYCTISELNAKFATIDGLSVESFSVTALGCTSGVFTNLTANTKFVFASSQISKKQVKVLSSATPALTEGVTLLVA